MATAPIAIDSRGRRDDAGQSLRARAPVGSTLFNRFQVCNIKSTLFSLLRGFPPVPLVGLDLADLQDVTLRVRRNHQEPLVDVHVAFEQLARSQFFLSSSSRHSVIVVRSLRNEASDWLTSANWPCGTRASPVRARLVRSMPSDHMMPASLWYGIDRTNRARTGEARVVPHGQFADVSPGHWPPSTKLRTTMTEYTKTTKEELRTRKLLEGNMDVYQWFLIISSHSQRHILPGIRPIRGPHRVSEKLELTIAD